MARNADWTGPMLRMEQMARSVAESHQLDESVEGAVRIAVELAPCDTASVSIRRANRDLELTAASSPVAERAHEAQRHLGEGPCLDVEWNVDNTHIVEDLADEGRWPRWAPVARDLGLRSMLAIRLVSERGTVGALNLYSTDRREYDTEDVQTALLVGARVSAVLSNALHEQTLWEAIDARHQVGIAQGILMERFGLDTDQAFSVLRRYSQERQTKLRQVAREVIRTRRLPPSEG